MSIYTQPLDERLLPNDETFQRLFGVEDTEATMMEYQGERHQHTVSQENDECWELHAIESRIYK